MFLKEKSIVPEAAEAGPREDLAEEETRMVQRNSEGGDSRFTGLAVRSPCDSNNRTAMATEFHQVGDPSPGEVTGEPAELGPGLSYSPNLSTARKAHEMLELR